MEAKPIQLCFLRQINRECIYFKAWPGIEEYGEKFIPAR